MLGVGAGGHHYLNVGAGDMAGLLSFPLKIT